MSYVVEKSVNSLLHSLVGASLPNVSNKSRQPSNDPSNNISQGLIKFVEKLEHAATISRQEEEEYVNKEYEYWLQKVSSQQVKISTIADILCRGLIAFSRGHRSFSFHIHAIKLTQCDSIYEQKIGSLYLSRTLAPDADLTLLLVNSLQVHLNSGNHLQIACGLGLLPLIANKEITSLLIQLVIACFKSPHAYIRKKAAIMAAVLCHSQYDKDFLYNAFSSNLSGLLGDPEPSVVIAAIVSLSEIVKMSDLLKDNMDVRNDLGRGCAEVILQAISKKLPESYNFNNTVVPMVLVQMLRALNNLAHTGWTPCDKVEETVKLVLSQTISDRTLGQCMTVIEAIHATAAISSNHDLISMCLSAAMRFIQSSNIDFKYVGIKALTQIFPKVKNLVGQTHVECVMECLYDCNPNLEKKTMKLLMAMVGPHNYQDLCLAILEYSMQVNDKRSRIEVHQFLSNILNDFSVDPKWCLKMLPLIVKSDVDSADLVTAMVQVISKGLVLSEDSSLWPDCLKMVKSVLSSNSIDRKSLRMSASLLSALIKSDVKLVHTEVHKIFYTNLNTLDNFMVYDKDIIDYITLTGIYEPSLRLESKSVLNKYLESVDFLSSFKVQESINLLEDHDSMKSLFSRQADILRHNAIDLTFSFADKFVNKCKLSAIYRPADLMEQIGRRHDQAALTASINSSVPADSLSFKLTPVSSVADVSVAGSMKEDSPKLVWTRDGRKAVETSFEVSANVSVNVDDEDSQSVEVADEATEDIETHKTANEERKLNLMSKFLKGLKLSD